MSHYRARGYSILELLIAVALGLILTVGLISIFVSSKQGYRVQESRGRMQENARFAVDYLARAIRLADFWGSTVPGSVTVLSSTPFTGACGTALQSSSTALTEGLRGYEGTFSTAPTDCTASRITASDSILVRYADPDTAITPSANITASQAALTTAAGDNGAAFVRSLAGGPARLFNALDSTALSSATSSIPFGETAAPNDLFSRPGAVINYKYRAEIYYLSTNPANVPSLYFSRNLTSGSNSSIQATELVEGIEMMKLEYGVDSNNDKLVDGYRTAGNVANWAQVLSVRLGLVVRGDERDAFADTDTYTMPGGYVYDPATADERFQRFQVVREVQIRNRTTFR